MTYNKQFEKLFCSISINYKAGTVCGNPSKVQIKMVTQNHCYYQPLPVFEPGDRELKIDLHQYKD